MATTGYPKIPVKAWRTLRSRAASAPSTKFTASSVAALLAMGSPESARNNIVLPMERVGLIGEDGGLTDLGNKWRLDASYPDACEQIMTDVYPDDLAALRDNAGAPDAGAIRTWFDHAGYGESNARQMAAFYVLLASKSIPDAATDSAPAKKKAAPTAKASPKPAAKPQAPPLAEPLTPPPPVQSGGPVVHLDIQIHIPAEATADQIDSIFASMAKHLYNR